MNKQKWTEKPVTWGGYLKLSGIVTVIGAIFSAVYIIAMFEPAWWIGIRKTVGKTFNHWALEKESFLKGWEPRNRRLLFFFFPPEVVFTKTGLRP